jgi:hypothetical protein
MRQKQLLPGCAASRVENGFKMGLPEPVIPGWMSPRKATREPGQQRTFGCRIRFGHRMGRMALVEKGRTAEKLSRHPGVLETHGRPSPLPLGAAPVPRPPLQQRQATWPLARRNHEWTLMNTKTFFNEAIKRNGERFPADFMFRLSGEE